MPNSSTAFLVIRRDDGFGDVFPLKAGQRCTIGRSTTNRIVLKDDLCSREHAEVLFADTRWYLRDLGSLNGTRVNGRGVREDVPLSPRDEIELGNTHLVFVENVQELPEVPTPAARKPARQEDKFEIRQRLSETHYLPGDSWKGPVKSLPTSDNRQAIDKNLARLYRLALEMGSAEAQQELVDSVLDALMELVKADVGAVLFLNEGRELSVIQHRHRDQKFRNY